MIVPAGRAVCPGCNEPLHLAEKAAIGRPRVYHNGECRQRAYRQRSASDSAAVFNPQFGEAAVKLCEQLDTVLGELARRIHQRGDTTQLLSLTPAIIKAALLIEKAAVAHLKLNGATWKQIGAVLSSNEDAVRHKYEKAAELVQRAMRVPGGELAQLVPEPGQASDKELPETAGELTAVQLVRDLLEAHARTGSSVTARQLARRAQVSPSYLSRILSENRTPSPKILGALLKVLLADADADPDEPAALHELRQVADFPHTLTPAEIAENLLILRAGSATRESIDVIRALARRAQTPLLAELLPELKARGLEPERTALLRALATETRYRVLMLINDLRATAPDQIPPLFTHLARAFSWKTIHLLNDLMDASHAAECRTLAEAVATAATPEAISTMLRWLSTRDDTLALTDNILRIAVRRRPFPVLVKLIDNLNANEAPDLALKIRTDLVDNLFEGHPEHPAATPLPSRTDPGVTPVGTRLPRRIAGSSLQS